MSAALQAAAQCIRHFFINITLSAMDDAMGNAIGHIY
jgi:hypothetical protein